jgi:phosphoglycerate dehydrogenase-like enzyme
MNKPRILVLAWLPDGLLPRLAERFPDFEWTDGRTTDAFEKYLGSAVIAYGLPPIARIADMPELRWIQLVAAGVPQELCPIALARKLTVTSLVGLYGNTIAEHAFALLTFLARNLHTAFHNQREGKWDRDIRTRIVDLHGRTLAIIGLGNIGQSIARLGRGYGLRVVGCRRTATPTPFVDQVYSLPELHVLLAEADFVAVAAPLTARTESLLGAAEFAAMKPGVLYVNVSRGSIAREEALLAALRSGHVTAAGLDAFAVEPLPAGHPFWSLPQVLISPHVSGETINQSARPAERFARNLAAWTAGRPLEGRVDLEQGY